MDEKFSKIHPQLLHIARRMPLLLINRFTLRIIRFLSIFMPKVRIPENMSVYQQGIRQVDHDYDLSLRIYKPELLDSTVPCLIWMHGGGMIMGIPQQNDAALIEFVKQLGIVIVSIDYRFAPDYPFPKPLEDCYAGLKWVYEHAQELSIDKNRISVGGESSGGGLAATLVQLAHDRKEIDIKFQFLVYPMLDDRTAVEEKYANRKYFVWNQKNNYFAWKAYLNKEPGSENIPMYAVASRREDLSGLPPAWICCGDLDMFYEEAMLYAQKLTNHGVQCEFESLQGVFHGFDSIPIKNEYVNSFRMRQVEILRKNMF